jgi:hypothetical protein
MTPRDVPDPRESGGRKEDEIGEWSILFSSHRGSVRIIPTLNIFQHVIVHNFLVVPEFSTNPFSMVRFASLPRQSVLMEGSNVSLSQNGSVILTATIKGSLSYLDVSTAGAVHDQQAFVAADLQIDLAI